MLNCYPDLPFHRSPLRPQSNAKALRLFISSLRSHCMATWSVSVPTEKGTAFCNSSKSSQARPGQNARTMSLLFENSLILMNGRRWRSGRAVRWQGSRCNSPYASSTGGARQGPARAGPRFFRSRSLCSRLLNTVARYLAMAVQGVRKGTDSGIDFAHPTRIWSVLELF